MTYYVYEYVMVEGKRALVRALVHQAECRACNHGEGYSYNAGAKRGLFKWHGPYATVDEARAFAEELTGKALSCRRCAPF